MKFQLGKGLQSLIPSKKIKNVSEEGIDFRKENVFNIEVDKIKPNPYQPREEMREDTLKELADSIKEYGILQPILVSKAIKEMPRGQDTEYQLIAGHRRLAAAKLLGLPHLPAIIRPSTSQEKIEIALAENLQREDLNPMERARTFKRLNDEFNLTYQRIAERVGKSREWVNNAVRLLNLPADIQLSLSTGQLTEGHARSLINIKDTAAQKALFEEILKNQLTVREVEQKTREVIKKTPSVDGADVSMLEFKNLVQQLEKFLEIPVSFAKSGPGGRLVIRFTNQDELKNLIKKMME